MITETVLQIVAHYGYIALFSLLVLGIVGLPVPDEILMVVAGFLVSKGKLAYFPTVLVAYSGSICGMSFSYFIGRRFGRPFLLKYGKRFFLSPERLDQTERWFERFGKFTVSIGYFIPGVRYFTAYLAGIGKWPYRTFALYAYSGGLIWVVTFVTLGLLFAKHWILLIQFLHNFSWATSIIIFIGIICWFICRRKKKQPERKT